jgi:hypothetical protein
MVTNSVPTKSAIGSSPIGSLLTIVTGRLEIVDFKKGRVDLFYFTGVPQSFKDLGFYEEIGLLSLWIDDWDRSVAGFTDRTLQFRT